MAASIFLCIFTFIFLSKIFPVNCKNVHCNQKIPPIHFQYLLKLQQIQGQKHPSWQIVCKDNITTIHFPSYGDLVVKAIFYDTKRMNLIDPKNCVHGVFLHLDLTLTPFNYFYALKNYTYLNCSTPLASSFAEIPCLSGSTYHVYTVETSMKVPVSCRKVKTVAIPFSYNPYISDNSFGLGLTWSLPGCEDCEAKSEQRGVKADEAGQHKCFSIALYKVVITIISLILVVLMIVKLYQFKKLHGQKGKTSESSKLLCDYRTLDSNKTSKC